MDFEIVHLPKDKWKGTILPIKYKTNEYYDVVVDKRNDGFKITIEKKNIDEPIIHRPEDYDFPDKLYADYYENPFAWGVIIDGKLIAAMETDRELWSNRLRITELWIDELYQKRGIGHSLIEVAKEQARIERRRAVILETQSCNVNAVDFYIHEGFTLIGMDTCCYKNDDLQRKEVRLEFGWFLEKNEKLNDKEVEIRSETEADYYGVELMTQKAFWNKHQMGCDEHYLVHRLRQHKDYIPELSRIAVKDGEVIGCIMYSKSKIVNGEDVTDVITFGPLCVDPKWHGCGVGELLLKETIKLAENEGYKGIVIFGEPDYYPRFGFKSCDKFKITTADGKNFDAFMALELKEGSLKAIEGKFFESEVFEGILKEDVEDYNNKFPKLKKVKLPNQWS